jgi:hypothetical protein
LTNGTSVDAGKLSSEVDQGGELVDAVLLGVPVVVHLHERDVQRIRLLQTVKSDIVSSDVYGFSIEMSMLLCN